MLSMRFTSIDQLLYYRYPVAQLTVGNKANGNMFRFHSKSSIQHFQSEAERPTFCRLENEAFDSQVSVYI